MAKSITSNKKNYKKRLRWSSNPGWGDIYNSVEYDKMMIKYYHETAVYIYALVNFIAKLVYFINSFVFSNTVC